MTEEIWKDIEGFEGKYQISNLGRVKSLNYRHTNKEKILKPVNKRGYLYVELCSNNKRKKIAVHQLVAKAFIPNPDNLKEVNHKDENKENNCVENLEWTTRKYNVRYSLAKKVACYKDNKLIKIYNTIRDVDNDGFYNAHVCKCCKGKIKTHHGFTWRYID